VSFRIQNRLPELAPTEPGLSPLSAHTVRPEFAFDSDLAVRGNGLGTADRKGSCGTPLTVSLS
jgi:hypothetical protein